MIIIKTELSALGIKTKKNPMVEKVIIFLKEKEKTIRKLLVVEQGCGQLRNTKYFIKIFNKIIIVDTEEQLTKPHILYDEKMSIREFVKKRWENHNIKIISSEKFKNTKFNADVVFSINVLDVTPPKIRKEILNSARKNLKKDGFFIAIVPRNDTWTLNRCKNAGSFTDGYILKNHNYHTFYRNWDDKHLKQLLRRSGFYEYENMSKYRQACFICKKR